MSENTRYKNPPLIQVTSSVWWHVEDSKNFEKSKFIAGILFPKLKEQYEDFEVLVGVNNPLTSLVLLNQEKQHVLEIAPNELKLSSVDENYCWNEFFEHVQFVNSLVIENLAALLELDHVHAALEYVDFFKYEYSSEHTDLASFLHSHLKFNIQAKILSNPSNISFGLKQKINESITSSVDMKLGKSGSEEGVIIHLKNDSNKIGTNLEAINAWFDSSHEVSKKQFEDIISGPLKDALVYDK